MLRIYPICLDIVEEVQPYVVRIAKYDPDLARQLRKASANAVLNVSEGSGNRGGRRRQAYEIALGEAKETRACLQIAERAKYVQTVSSRLLAKLERVIGTLWKVTH